MRKASFIDNTVKKPIEMRLMMRGQANLWRSIDDEWELISLCVVKIELEIYPKEYKYIIRALDPERVMFNSKNFT